MPSGKDFPQLLQHFLGRRENQPQFIMNGKNFAYRQNSAIIIRQSVQTRSSCQLIWFQQKILCLLIYQFTNCDMVLAKCLCQIYCWTEQKICAG